MIDERRHSLVGLAFAVAVGIVVGSVAVAAIFAVLGAIFGVVGWLVHTAFVIGVIALVWWLLIGRRRAARCDSN